MTSFSFPTSRPGRRLFICVRGNCAESEVGRRLEKRLADLIQQHGLDVPDHPQHTTCTLANCLGVCEAGPIMMVQPEGIKYHHVDGPALERIFQEHILQNRPVEELILRHQPSRSILKRKT